MVIRTGAETRKTKETDVAVKIILDGQGKNSIATGMPFWDHMLTLLSTHSLFDLDIKAQGDTEIDDHHTLEDVGIALGTAYKKALGDARGITRFANVTVPMDEALAECVIDISKRALLVYRVPGQLADACSKIQLAEEFFRAFVQNAGITCHLIIKEGANEHHMLEAAFKALGRCLRQAVSIDKARPNEIPSSKGVL